MESPDPLLERFPFCKDLRSKKLAFAKGPPMSEEDVLDASRRVWCRRTMTALGPDGDIVDTDLCRPGRECHQPCT